MSASTSASVSASPSPEDLKRQFLQGNNTWTQGWEDLLRLDPVLFERYMRMHNVPQSRQHLSLKEQEFIWIAVQACSTTAYSPGVRAHIKAALAVGATQEEIMEVIGMTSLVGIHTVTQAVPILFEVLQDQGKEDLIPALENDPRREAIKQDFIQRRKFWTDTWNPVLRLDPDFFEAYMSFSSLPNSRNVIEPKIRELIYCAFDASTTHLYNRGTKIHMRNAVQLGATPEQIMDMLEIVSFVGMNGVLDGASLLAQEVLATEAESKI
ncbi:hypothetical protein A1O3_03224 [Capronia epimyces CBS 606.96]|uniref:Carboxymuconolactone decarboxylase-like domain-containing protein n=1 Tax=Capronia epimyces CBS 606.96 TaxID=1182542 RepID=W9YKD4_9EURO|nr:uncharacterized protein A1O3_03224 [Capronia epimyces CBS 606.96]EXJ90155.1 hypothetical protein A1O3_03224 [Capronia epimyces CBS 606.96]